MTRLSQHIPCLGSGMALFLPKGCTLAYAGTLALWAASANADGAAQGATAGAGFGAYDVLARLGAEYWAASGMVALVSLLVTGGLWVALARRRRAYAELVNRLSAACPAASADVTPAARLDALATQQQKATAEAAAERARAERAETTLAALTRSLTALSEGALAEACDLAEDAPDGETRDALSKALSDLNAWQVEFAALAVGVDGSTGEITQATDDLSKRTETQAATLEETAAALDELTAGIKSAAEGARSVESIVQSAREEAEQSGQVVKSAVQAMTEIEGSSEKISQIIGVIDDIAFQTNLLALNAGVEAARAGEYGKGFSVVASEVRALAQRSSEAAHEIKSLISGSTDQVARGVELVGRTGEALAAIVDRVSNISTLVSDIAASATEQSAGLAEINAGVTQLDQVTQQNAAMVEELTATSHLLAQEARRLSRLAGTYRPRADDTETQTGGDGHLLHDDSVRVTPAPLPAPPALTGTDGGNWQDF